MVKISAHDLEVELEAAASRYRQGLDGISNMSRVAVKHLIEGHKDGLASASAVLRRLGVIGSQDGIDRHIGAGMQLVIHRGADSVRAALVSADGVITKTGDGQTVLAAIAALCEELGQ